MAVVLTLILGVVLLGVVAILLVARRRFLSSGYGQFECAMKFNSNDRWHNGVARFNETELEWYRSLSLARKPQRVWSRHEFSMVSRELIEEGLPELTAIPVICVKCRVEGSGEIVELALGRDSLHGLSSWSESGPPGVRSSGY